jgi:hypothetical protein
VISRPAFNTSIPQPNRLDNQLARFDLSSKEIQLDVTTSIVGAFQRASERNRPLHELWIKVSVRAGSVLPHSRLSGSIQSAGALDVVLRCMEDDNPTAMQLEEDNPGLFFLHYQLLLSEFWIGSVYEILRLVKEHCHPADDSAVVGLAHDLRLLRIPLEKHQIAQDRMLTEPLRMQRFPPNGNETDIFEYSKTDPKRSHIMPIGISPRGSCMWQVIDLVASSSFWIERREISERILKIWETEPAVT